MNRHPDTVFIEAASTYGSGETYVGRNKMDTAALDRCVVVPASFAAFLKVGGTMRGGRVTYRQWRADIRFIRKGRVGQRRLKYPLTMLERRAILNHWRGFRLKG